MARHLASLLLVCALAAGAPIAAGALPISILEVERAAEAEASAADASDADFDSAASFDAGLGLQDWSSAANAVVPPAAMLDALGGYRGSVSADAIEAQGVAQVGATTTASDAFAFGSAEARQRIVFQATADALLRVSGGVIAQQIGDAGDAVALLEIMSLGGVGDPSPLLIQRRAEPGQEALFDVDFAVRSGMSYQILSLARASADALDLEHSFFRAAFLVELTEVPEPGSAMLLLLGSVALAIARRR